MNEPTGTVEASTWPACDREMGVRIRAFDWLATPLGPIGSWPQHLRTLVDLVLDSPAMTSLMWGPGAVQIYNGAYAASIGDRHPAALGVSAFVTFADARSVFGPLFDRAMAGESVVARDLPFRFAPGMPREEAWFDLSYTPVRGAGGAVAGVLAVLTETTERVLAERQRAGVEVALRESEARLRVNEARLRAQKEAFQAVADGAPLATSLGMLTRLVTSETAGEGRSAFYLADSDGRRLHPVRGAGDMPDAYLAQIDGFPIGEDSLACGLAVPTGRPVTTPDVLDDPRWRPWTHLAEAYRFRGCWSFPIKMRESTPVGIFALYFREPREPATSDLELADLVTQSAAVIIAGDLDARRRARAEAALRENADRQAFLLDLGDRIRSAADAAAIAEATAETLARHLGVARCLYGEVDATGEYFIVHRDWTDGSIEGLAGQQRLDDFGDIADVYRSGQLLIVNDAGADPRTVDGDDACRRIGHIRSVVGVPLMKGGRLVALFGVHHTRPRQWTEAETALVKEVAERTWAAVERAGVEAALRESEEKFRTLFEAINQGFYIAEVLQDGAGKLASEVIPEFGDYRLDQFDRVVRTVEPMRMERFNESSGRWYQTHYARIGGPGSRRVSVTVDDTTERTTVEAALRESEASLQRRVAERTAELTRLNAERTELLRRLVVAQEEERCRVAHEVHDGVTQLAHAASLRLDDLADRLEGVLSAGDLHDLERARDMARSTAREARRLIAGLRPEALDAFGLAGALRQEVETLRAEGLPVEFRDGDPLANRMSPAAEITLYRVAQEALANVRKHAGAAPTLVRLRRINGTVVLEVRDRGAGFRLQDAAVGPGGERVGLVGMRERVALLGGTLAVTSRPGRGTRVVATVPVDRQ